VRFTVTSKKSDLSFEKRNVQLYVLISVFDEALRVCEELVNSVRPSSNQQCNKA